MKVTEGTKYQEQRETILRYCESCPRAADTVEGVVNWWLPRQRFNDARQEIEIILEELVVEGRLVKSLLPDNNVVYSCKSQESSEGSASVG